MPVLQNQELNLHWVNANPHRFALKVLNDFIATVAIVLGRYKIPIFFPVSTLLYKDFLI